MRETEAQTSRRCRHIPQRIIAIDLETTGMDPSSDAIIEVAAVRFVDGERTESFHSLVDPACRLPYFITMLTGIRDDMLIGAPRIYEILPSFLRFVGADVLLGHNVCFDLAQLESATRRHCGVSLTNEYIDTLLLSRRLFPNYRHHRLCDLTERFMVDTEGAHRAMADALAAYDCYRCLLKEMDRQGLYMEALTAPRRPRIGACPPLPTEPPTAWRGLHVAFMGSLQRVAREDALRFVQYCGAYVDTRYAARTDILVLGRTRGDGPYGKPLRLVEAEKRKAESADLCILTEDEFMDFWKQPNLEEKVHE